MWFQDKKCGRDPFQGKQSGQAPPKVFSNGVIVSIPNGAVEIILSWLAFPNRIKSFPQPVFFDQCIHLIFSVWVFFFFQWAGIKGL